MNVIQQLQLDIFGRLSAADYFVDVSVYLIRPRSKEEATLLQTKIDNALAGLEKKNGKSGAACLVNMPSADVDEPKVQGPYLTIIPSVRIIENPLVNMSANGTGKSAEEIATNVLGELHQWTPWGSGNIQRALFAERGALNPVESYLDQGKIAYDAVLKTRYQIAPENRVNIPKITVAGGLATIVTDTAGAAIYYTVDGSYPAPISALPSSTALLYSVPFAVTSGQLIRAVAYKTNLQASNVSSLISP